MMIEWCVVFFLVGGAFAQETPQLILPQSQDNSSSSLGIPASHFNTEERSTTILPEVDTEEISITTIRPTVTTFKNANNTTSTIATTSTPPIEEDTKTQKNHEDSIEELQNSALIQATKKLHSKTGDPKEDFLNFVQTALRSSDKQQNRTDQMPRAPVLIKKLIGIKPRLNNMPTFGKASPKFPSRNEVTTTSEPGYVHEDFRGQAKIFNHLKAQSDLNRNVQQEQEASLPPPISQRKKVSVLRNGIRPSQNTMKERNGNLGLEVDHYDFNGEQIPHRFQWYETERSFRPTADFSALRQTKTSPKQVRLYNNFNPNRRTPDDTQPNYYPLQQQISSSPYSVPLQRRVLTSSPRRKVPEEDYDPEEVRRQAQSAKYSFESDIEDNINGNLQQRQESREGNKVTGSYTYEDGFYRRTVHYVADEKGYRVVKEKVDEIGDGPLYNSDGSAKFHAYIAGNNVNYQITNKDISRTPQVKYQQHHFEGGNEWRY